MILQGDTRVVTEKVLLNGHDMLRRLVDCYCIMPLADQLKIGTCYFDIN